MWWFCLIKNNFITYTQINRNHKTFRHISPAILNFGVKEIVGAGRQNNLEDLNVSILTKSVCKFYTFDRDQLQRRRGKLEMQEILLLYCSSMLSSITSSAFVAPYISKRPPVTQRIGRLWQGPARVHLMMPFRRLPAALQRGWGGRGSWIHSPPCQTSPWRGKEEKRRFGCQQHASLACSEHRVITTIIIIIITAYSVCEVPVSGIVECALVMCIKLLFANLHLLWAECLCWTSSPVWLWLDVWPLQGH